MRVFSWLWPLVLVCNIGLVNAASRGIGNQVFGTVTVLDSEGNEIDDKSNVVVFLDGFAIPEAEWQPDADIPRVSHKGRVFSPAVLPIVKGGQINFLNDDDIYHNVFSLSRAKPFDLGIYPEGASKVVVFDQPGLVKLYCNIHPGMVSSVLVLNNPYYAITDDAGEFFIGDVPPGDFTLRSWHALSEGQVFSINVSDGADFRQDLEIRITKKTRQHKNKFGKNYRSKY